MRRSTISARSSLTLAAALLGATIGTTGCTGDLDDEGLGDIDKDAVITEEVDTGLIELSVTESYAAGRYYHDDIELHFEAEVQESTSEVTLEVRGMILLLTIDHETGAFDVDGFAAENGVDTQMTPEDRALLQALDAALGALTAEQTQPSQAIDLLIRASTLFGDYSSSLPLQRAFYGRLDRSSSMCGSVNKPGQGVNTKLWSSATHDCNDTAGDCSNWWGCSRWDDNATTDHVFMSMHPDGGCSDDTYFGGSSTSLSCHEPDHPGGTEYAYGGCFGRCGGGCGSGTQFTRACLDHDQCVRLGHSLASFWCTDEFSDTGWDVINAPHCSGVSFTVDYNWAGGSTQNNCPTSWNGTNDGCDHGCQFIDGDCFR
ncbi:MAG: hypothetical protein K0V04_41290 [Deltaproteobacteria bacterium]|nr:hypothetical protein [Deltaproteobacteria bacterium]